MSKQSYRIGYTLWKAAWTWLHTIGVVGAADVLAVEWPEDATAERVTMYCLTVLPAAWRALENWRKNSGPGGLARFEWREVWMALLDWILGKLGLTLCLGLVCWACVGCNSLGGTVSTEFRETVTDPQGQPITTEYRAVSKAGMFGELSEANQNWRYRFGDNEITTGQAAQGLDNAGNAEALRIMADTLQAAFTVLLRTYEARAAEPPAPEPAQPGWWPEIE